MSYPMTLTFALLGLAIAITGGMGFAFFWPMTLVHLRDRHPDAHALLVNGGALSPASLLWLLAGRFRTVNDPGLNGLATPGRIALVVLLFGLVNAGVFGLTAWAIKP